MADYIINRLKSLSITPSPTCSYLSVPRRSATMCPITLLYHFPLTCNGSSLPAAIAGKTVPGQNEQDSAMTSLR